MLLVANVVLSLVLVALPWLYYPYLPEVIPTHFGLNGKPDAWAPKEEATYLFIILSVALPLANVVIALITAFRFALVVRYPYLVNLPAFTYLISSDRFTPRDRGIYVNRMFRVVLVIGVLLGAYLISLEYATLHSMVVGVYPPALIVCDVVVPLVITLVAIYLYWGLYMEVKGRVAG